MEGWAWVSTTQQEQQSGGTPRWRKFADPISYIMGWVLLDSQVGIVRHAPANPNETAMWIAALLIGVPGVLQVIMWRFGQSGGSTPAASSSPGPAPEGSPSPPSPSS
jgi:hypothetical protein